MSRTSHKIGRIKALIWDLDNTLYRLDEALYHAFDIGFARAVVEAGVPLSLQEAATLARESFMKTGFSGQVFIDRYGVDHRSLHFSYHGYVDEKVIRACLETRDLFDGFALDNVLLTHGSRDWATRVLDHVGLSTVFPPERVLALEDYNFRMKNECRSGFEAALEKLGSNAADTAIVEDSHKNLKIPFEMGMTTILVHHGQEPAHLPPYVDICVQNAPALLRMLRED